MEGKAQKGAKGGGEQAKTYYNASPVAIDLSDGRMLQPSEQVTGIAMNRHNKFLVDSGSLVEVNVGGDVNVETGEGDQEVES